MLFLTLTASQVFGDTINFGDNSIYWPEWSTRDSANNSGTNPDTNKNISDTWGTPNILRGTATITNGYLTQVTFNVQSTNSDWNVLKPADLFIDTNNDKTWDYVVNMIDGNNNPGNKGLYAINQPLYNTTTNGNYILSNVPGYRIVDIRDNQPIAVNNLSGTSIDTVAFNGWPSSLGDGQKTTVSFNFGAQDILLGSQFDIGWTVNCANDVIYETLNNPVPEPATMLLMGVGLIGLAGFGRRKFGKAVVER